MIDPNIIYVCAVLTLSGTAAKLVMKEAIGLVVLYKQFRFTLEFDHQRWWDLEIHSPEVAKKALPKRAGKKAGQRHGAVKQTRSKGASGRTSRKNY